MRNAQNQIAINLEKRGYWGGWTVGQVLCRQTVKMLEELLQLSKFLLIPGDLIDILQAIEEQPRVFFNDKNLWKDTGINWSKSDPDIVAGLKKEITDMQLVIFQMARAVEEITGQRFDVVKAAVEKSSTI